MRRIICTRLHTSAGRIPTDQGFRYYVKYRMSFDSLSQSEKRYISTQLLSLPLAIEKWMRMATQQLTRTLRTASIITYPIAETRRFKHLELISIQGRFVFDGVGVASRLCTPTDANPSRPTLTGQPFHRGEPHQRHVCQLERQRHTSQGFSNGGL
jgi:hypothetical protein